MPAETRPGQCLKSNATVNDSFATIANKIEVEEGIEYIPVAMHHVNLPIDCHAPFLIKQLALNVHVKHSPDLTIRPVPMEQWLCHRLMDS